MAEGVVGETNRGSCLGGAKGLTLFFFCSNCGSYAPQSCIFGQILNTGAALGKYFQTFPFITSPKLPKGFLYPPPPDQSNRLP